ncbi:MAG: transposase, partial [Acetobacteraceae bacterium]|nr:transposase [Acetobacteraceae bacterium]
EPLHEAYVPDQGRPAIPPETLVRALVLGYLYRIPSFRKLCTAIQENLAFRWFLYLGLEDEVFDPSFSSPFRPAEGSTPRARPPWDSVEGGDRLQRYPHYVSEGDGPRQCGEGRVPCSDSTTRGGCDMQIRGASGRETRRCPR